MSWLEREASNQFHCSAADGNAGDLFRRVVATLVVARLPEARVVQDVCRFCPNLEFHSAIRNNVKGLAKREVDIAQARTIDLVPFEGTEVVGVVGGIFPRLRTNGIPACFHVVVKPRIKTVVSVNGSAKRLCFEVITLPGFCVVPNQISELCV